MKYELEQSKMHPQTWIAQAIDNDGKIFRTIFDYSCAKQRAQEYIDWMNRQKAVQDA